ncbi:MAG TPA: MaoC family dehydratase N-terminal domain-containing protein [Mycobacteriales bacterium]|nr:MaoC family dehydratase N-terminal domain-containing protein [Mycobacteriales bacterium]
MAVNPSFIGRTYPPSEPYEVGREKIREFAAAVGDDNPAYHDPKAAHALGYPDVIAPPTFPVLVSFLASRQVIDDPELGLDYSRVVHGEQRFVYRRPVRAGDRLVALVSVDNIRQAAGNDIITTRLEVSTADGEQVVTIYSTLVARGTAAVGAVQEASA